MTSGKEHIQVESTSLDASYNELTDFHSEKDADKYGQTERGLNSRHVNLMIIGSFIGTGLFVGMGSLLITSGSLSLFIGFVIWLALGVWPKCAPGSPLKAQFYTLLPGSATPN
ncbi:hypothetical protein BABINDRAFT_160109 [Babjeviella inositovora NRRL Y-12698]|uniref:Amino acid permease/ SLC12A domain-containing protein n=1 Tax=Babjeviella inositovora NRRL Y-12698 TaxID=984486 RepID=A0A1E3QW34_9ASCO|nr:uncharacterized protein BABINDRAFT_160109 [Babjeviella inositovora NRRL Y-12698]ODQ81879.1 hypothetical protein BABINDRAFT_160109 [Babjeviella inositovora NRRL Y-12698]